MESQFFVGRTIMFDNMRSWSHCWKESMFILSRK